MGLVAALMVSGCAQDPGAALDRQAMEFYHQGRYAEGIPLAVDALAIREKALGPEHPDVALGLNDLAVLYNAQGRSAEAEPLYKRSLAIWEKARGPEDPDVARGLSNLATLYQNQGRYDEAEPLYKRSLAISEKALGLEHPDVAVGLNNLAVLLKIRGRYAAAEPLYKRSLAIYEKLRGPEHPDVALELSNLAALYQVEGRVADAEPLYRRSLAIWEKVLGAEHPSLAVSLNNLGMLYQQQGRDADAEPLFERSLAIKEKVLGPEHPDLAVSLDTLAGLYVVHGRYADAEALYKRGLAISEKARGPDHPDVGLALNGLAQLYRSQHRDADAEPLLKRSLAIEEAAFGPEHPEVAAVLNNLAASYQAQGRYTDAEALYKRSLAIHEATLGPEHPAVALLHSNLADLHQTQRRSADALRESRRAVAILRHRFSDAGADRAGVGSAERRSQRAIFLQNVELAYAVGGPTAAAEAFDAAQLADITSAAQAVAGMAARFASGSDALAAIVRERQDLADRWQHLDATLLKAISLPADRRDAAAETELRAQLADTGARLDALDARIAKDFPEYAELSQPRPIELAAAQALLAPDEALLVYLVGGDRTWLLTLRRDRAALHKVDNMGPLTLGLEVTALRSRLDPDQNPTLLPFDARRAYALYQKVLAPAMPLLDDARQVFVVPDGPLESLPIGVLVTRPPTMNPETPADHRALAWFAREHAVSVLPSVGSLKALRQFAAAPRAASPFVGIGDPALEGRPGAARGVKLASLFRGGGADVDAVRQLDPLPDTADELRAVAAAVGASERDLYLRQRATEPVLRSLGLERYNIIEFATHGLMSGDLEGLAEPALVLTPPPQASPENDGLLTASEIATLKLNADWVVLSACNTAAGDGTPDGGGLSGLAKAFFYAGARSLLVSHWSVPSQATVILITGAFEALKRDPSIGRAEALRRSEMAMMDPANPPEFSHPLAWAPFVLAGEGSRPR